AAAALRGLHAARTAVPRASTPPPARGTRDRPAVLPRPVPAVDDPRRRRADVRRAGLRRPAAPGRARSRRRAAAVAPVRPRRRALRPRHLLGAPPHAPQCLPLALPPRAPHRRAPRLARVLS